MRKVYQTIFGVDNGNCWQAVMASMLELSLEDVPHFVSLGDDSFRVYSEFLKSHGYIDRKQIPNPRRLKHFGLDLFKKEIEKASGINGYFKACVYSPGFFTPALMCTNKEPTHAVVIDKNFNIVHDPNPEYQNIGSYPLSEYLGYNGVISFDVIDRI